MRAANCFPGAFVSIKPRNNRQVIASGQIVESGTETGKCLLRILRVNIPAYKVKRNENQAITLDDSLVPLSEFGEPPFEIKVSKNDLVTEDEINITGNSTDVNQHDTNQRNTSLIDQDSSNSETNNGSIETNNLNELFNTIFGATPRSVDKESFSYGYLKLSSIS